MSLQHQKQSTNVLFRHPRPRKPKFHRVPGCFSTRKIVDSPLDGSPAHDAYRSYSRSSLTRDDEKGDYPDRRNCLRDKSDRSRDQVAVPEGGSPMRGSI